MRATSMTSGQRMVMLNQTRDWKVELYKENNSFVAYSVFCYRRLTGRAALFQAMQAAKSCKCHMIVLRPDSALLQPPAL
jgi:hypothetical protein